MDSKTQTHRVFLRRFACLLLVFCLISSSLGALAAYSPNLNEYSHMFVARHQSWPSYEDEAYVLQSLGLFQGTEQGFELSRAPTRTEALVTVIRLIGKEDEAKRENLTPSFTDVPSWARAYVGYGEANGLVQGIGDKLFGAADQITALQYATMMLRVLGYSDQDDDFTYENALEFSLDQGLIDNRALGHFGDSSAQMLRGDMVYFMYRALRADMQGSGKLLLLTLCEEGALSSNTVYGSMMQRGESAEEVERALSNGYSEYWYAKLCRTIDDNQMILSQFNPVFKTSAYAFLKEPVPPEAASQLAYTLSNVKTSVALASEDSVFSSSPNTLAYFQYPDRIVSRLDLNSGLELSAFTHEMRHATTRNIENTTVEEGFTDLWNHEVNDGLPAYQYYYINTAKTLAFLVGAARLNEIDLFGGLEDLMYSLEVSVGMRLNKDDLSYHLYQLSEYTDLSATMETVQGDLLQLLSGYYDNQYQNIIASASGKEEYIDTLIALAQLLYYPSSMVQNVDMNEVSQSPSSFYTPDCIAFIDANLTRYSAETGEGLSSLKSYYDQNCNQRYCMKFFGPDAGNMLVKNSAAYVVTYSYDGKLYSETFGSAKAAKAFESQVKVTNTKEVSGAAFVRKLY